MLRGMDTLSSASRDEIKDQFRAILVCPSCNLPLLKTTDADTVYCSDCDYESTMRDAANDMRLVLLENLFNIGQEVQSIWEELVKELG